MCRATFFLVGRLCQQRPDIAREVVKAGHVVGNHTFTHPSLTFKGSREVTAQLSDCERPWRTPWESIRTCFVLRLGLDVRSVLRIARQLNLEPVMWNVTGYDWNAPSVEIIERKVIEQMSGRRCDSAA